MSKGDVIFAMMICSVYLQDIPMGFREKVVLTMLIMKYMDLYIKTEADLLWVNNQIKKMESEMKSDGDMSKDLGQRLVSGQSTVEQVALCRTDSAQWNWPSDA